MPLRHHANSAGYGSNSNLQTNTESWNASFKSSDGSCYSSQSRTRGQHFVSDTGLEGDATEPIWIAFDILMLIGLPIAIIISFRRFVKSRNEDVAERLLASFMPMLVVVTSVLFVEQLLSVELLAPEGYEITQERLALWESDRHHVHIGHELDRNPSDSE